MNPLALLSIILLFNFSTVASAQVAYKGRVVNSATGKAIPYITVNLVKEDISVPADELCDLSDSFTLRLLIDYS